MDVEAVWASHNHWSARQRQLYPPINAAVLWLVESGRLEARLEGVPTLVEPGEVFWQPPGVRRQLRAEEDASWYSVALQARWFGREPVWPPAPAQKWVLADEERSGLKSTLAQMVRLRYEPTLSAALQFNGQAQWLVGFCLEKLGVGQAESSLLWPDWLRVALAALNSEPQIEIGALATRVGYSPTQFRVKFRHYLGKSPGEYAQDCLGQRARMLLMGTNMPVAQVAQELGFAEPTHFTRFFKRRYGVTPLQFKIRSFGEHG